MLSRLNPQAPKEEQTPLQRQQTAQKKRWLLRFLYGVEGLFVLSLILYFVGLTPEGQQRAVFWTDVIALSFLTLALFLVRKNLLWWGSLCAILLGFGLVVYGHLVFYRTTINTSTLGYFLLLSVSWVLLGLRTSSVMFGLTFVLMAYSFVAEMLGILKPSGMKVSVFDGFALLFIYTLSYLIQRSIHLEDKRQAKEAQEIAAALQKSNEELQRTQESLEEQVSARTEELARSNRHLQEREEELHALLEFAPEAIVVVNTKTGLLERPNARALELFGLSRAQLCKLGPTDLSPPLQPDGVPSGEKAEALLQEAMNGGNPSFEWLFLNAQKGERLCETRLSRLPGEHSHLVRGTVTDITERKKLEEALRQNQKLESLGLLAGGIAHDFNNLLVAIMGQSSLALERLEPSSSARPHLEQALHASQQAASLTKQMLAFSGRSKFEVHPIQCNRLMEESLRLFEASIPKKIQLEKRFREPLPLVEGDPSQLQQVVINLLLNAIQAIGDQAGTITLESSLVTFTEEAPIRWGRHTPPPAPGRYVQLTVEDDGCGMDSPTLSQIFDPFFTTKMEGTGLGLAAVLGILRGHKGGLRVNSTPGKGTVFSLLLPTQQSASTTSPFGVVEKPAAEQPALASDKKQHVLVIDDEPVVCGVVKEMLAIEEIPTYTAHSGEEGLALFRAHQDEIGLILLDLSMPGMDGKETFEALRKIDPNISVVLSSGFDRDEATATFVGQGIADFLQKPYDLKTLSAKVRTYL